MPRANRNSTGAASVSNLRFEAHLWATADAPPPRKITSSIFMFLHLCGLFQITVVYTNSGFA